MADLATLGVVVKSSGIKQTESDLKGLSREGAKAEKQAASLASAWGKKLGAAVLVGTGIAVVAIRRIVQNTIEADKVQAQLAARIKSTGGVAGLTVKGLNDMADGLQRITTFDDESIGGAQALLLTFTKIGKDVFPDATKAVLDMSTALGTDLNSAALQVGKALNDPVRGITALSRAGVQFSESQRETIKQLVETGRVAEAQTIILAELETQMGGSAEAARNTLGGALTALGNSFDNLLEGDTSGGGVRGSVDAINKLNDALNDPGVRAGFQEIISGAANAATAVAGLVSGLANLTKGVAEQLAVNVGGIGGDDIKRLEEQAAKLRTRLAEQKERFVLIDIGGNEAKIEADLKKVEGQLTSFYERSAQAGAARLKALAAAASPANALEDGGTTIISAGDEFGADRGKPKAAGGGAGRSRADALDSQTESMGEYLAGLQAVAEEERLQDERWEALTAQLNGPLAQAEYEHKQRLTEISQAGKDAGASSDEIAQALAKETQAYAEQTAAIQAQLDPLGQLLSDIAFETELLGLNGVERQKAIALRYANADAASVEGKAITDALDAQEERLKDVEGIEFARNATKGVFQDLIDGVGSAQDAVDDYFDNLRAKALQILADKLFDGLFDGLSAGAGAGNGGLGGFLGSLFGGGRAIGGPVSGNRLYEVGEKGQPELLDIRGKRFLIPGASGRVTPMAESNGGGGSVVNQTINVQGTVSRHTASQLQREAHLRQQLAGAR